MISVQEAQKIIMDTLSLFPTIDCPVTEAEERVLEGDIFAERDLPPYNRVTMDGIAIAYSAWQRGQRTFKLVGAQAAGQAPLAVKDDTTCIEIMTGSALDKSCDCVIPYEQLTLTSNEVTVSPGTEARLLQNIHVQGSDCKKAQVVLRRGVVLGSPQIAIAAAVGCATVPVRRAPSIVIVTTGNEVVDICDPVLPYQIRETNGYAIRAALHRSGFKRVERMHLPDEKRELARRLDAILSTFDVLILSGGISKGRFDLVPSTLEELGVKCLFHGVNQRPGKPFWYGRSKRDQPVFALPGNPVSALICFHRYVLPFLNSSISNPESAKEFALLREPFIFEQPMTYFLPVKVTIAVDGNRTAQPMPTNTSGDFITLAESDGFIELPAKIKHFPAGYKTLLYRWG